MSNKLPKVGVSGILYENGKVLLAKRADDDEALPGLWNTPGGGLEWREKIDVGIMREYREEVGLDVIPKEGFLWVGDALYLPERHNVLIFKEVGRGPCELRKPMPLDGISMVMWFGWGEIMHMAAENQLTPMTRLALNDFYNHITYGNNNH